MRKIVVILSFIFIFSSFELPLKAKGKATSSFLLLVSEQNIEAPRTCWWLGEIDLSTLEANLSKVLIKKGYIVIAPSAISKVVKSEKAFQRADLADNISLKLAKISRADYVIIGKAIASKGPNIPDSHMFSCFANATIKLIRVKDGDVLAYLNSTQKTISLDAVSGGEAALAKAGKDLGHKIIGVVSKLVKENKQ